MAVRGSTCSEAAMTEIRFRGTVPMPRTEVFDYFVDARLWPAWFPGVEAVDDIEGWGAPGGRCRLTVRVLGRRRTFHCQMTKIDRPQLFAYVAREEGLPTSSHEGRFVEVAEGTRVEISARRDPRRGPAGFYDRIVVARALKRMMDRSMASLATTLTERRRRASGST
ncbi:MAG TPA: SRPBCC family protein [Pilimelia sp.]|nr:SRPBCC family protein [Pilimelia sp.]